MEWLFQKLGNDTKKDKPEDIDDPGALFFKKLAESEDINIFKNTTIQKIIRYKWEQCFGDLRKYLIIPFICLAYIPYMFASILIAETDDF